MNYISQTIKSYEDNSEKYFERKKGNEKDSFPFLKKFKKFIKGKSILEIGFGTGEDAEWFLDNDFFYTGVDPVLIFCKKLHDKIPWVNIINSDVRMVEFRPQTFNGIWAMASLLHLSDEDLKTTLKKFHTWLKTDGILYVSLKKGSHKITRDDGRFFNLFSQKRFLKITGGQFELLDFSENTPKAYNTGKENWLNFYLRKI